MADTMIRLLVRRLDLILIHGYATQSALKFGPGEFGLCSFYFSPQGPLCNARSETRRQGTVK